MVMVRCTGYRFTTQATDEKSKCSQRIVKTIRAIRNHAIIRQKLLNGDKISDFCASPQAYAQTTVGGLWNNSKREANGKAAASGFSTHRKALVMNGSVARRYQEQKTLSAREKQEVDQTGGDDIISTGEFSIDRGLQSYMASQRRILGSWFPQRGRTMMQQEKSI
jgi:hypothetical protein